MRRLGATDCGEHRQAAGAAPQAVASENMLNKDGAFGCWSADAVRAQADTPTLVDAVLALASLAEDRGRSI